MRYERTRNPAENVKSFFELTRFLISSNNRASSGGHLLLVSSSSFIRSAISLPAVTESEFLPVPEISILTQLTNMYINYNLIAA